MDEMNLSELQNKIREFDKARNWDKDWHVKDLSLNMTEEIGEFWNLIKWVGVKEQKKIIENKKEEVSDFVGDMLFLILKIANKANVDAEKALKNTLKEFEERMPPEKMKEVKHANKLAGGFDNKQNID